MQNSEYFVAKSAIDHNQLIVERLVAIHAPSAELNAALESLHKSQWAAEKLMLQATSDERERIAIALGNLHR